jgi:hypothetical protein
VHASPELASTTTGIVVFFALGSIPLPSAQSLEFSQAIALAFGIHCSSILAFLAALLFCNLFAFEK